MVRRDDPNDDNGVIADLAKRVRRLEASPQIGNTSVDSGALVVKSAEGLLVQGTARTTGSQSVDGVLYVDGHLRVNGDSIYTGPVSFTGPFSNVGAFTNSGAFTNTGKLTQNGDADLNGNTKIAGNTTITGNTELQSDLNVTGGGKIVLGGLTLDPTGGFGGQIIAGGSGVVYVNATSLTAGHDLTVLNDLRVFGALTVTGAKSFGMEHPSKPGVMLRHAATESPVSGLEYWGEASLDNDGSAVIQMPDYFDDLAKTDGRTVFVTGRGFSPDWTDIESEAFTVSGPAGGRFSWLVKAERFGGDFVVESPMTDTDKPELPQENSGQ